MIEIITGPMFSGKSGYLIRMIKREILLGQRPLLCKPSSDLRDGNSIRSREGHCPLESFPVTTSEDILPLWHREGSPSCVAIDEAQFLDGGVVSVCKTLQEEGVRVVVCGLDMDYLGDPFEHMAMLMALAATVTKLTAVCYSKGCRQDATMTKRIGAGGGRILAGDDYLPSCWAHHRK